MYSVLVFVNHESCITEQKPRTSPGAVKYTWSDPTYKATKHGFSFCRPLSGLCSTAVDLLCVSVCSDDSFRKWPLTYPDPVWVMFLGQRRRSRFKVTGWNMFIFRLKVKVKLRKSVTATWRKSRLWIGKWVRAFLITSVLCHSIFRFIGTAFVVLVFVFWVSC